MSNGGRAVYLALGSNLGDRRENLRAALARLKAERSLVAVSSLYQTEPVGGIEQPAFYNAVCQIDTDEPLSALLQRVKHIEWEMGRRPSVRWGPRPLDLDLLLAGEELCETAELSVPHPRLSERGFVLAPLVELAADELHPVLGCTVDELYAALPEPERKGITRLDITDWWQRRG